MSDLQRVANDLVASLNEAARIADALRSTARKADRYAAVADSGANRIPGLRRTAAMFREAARDCRNAAARLDQASRTAISWARSVAGGGGGTGRRNGDSFGNGNGSGDGNGSGNDGPGNDPQGNEQPGKATDRVPPPEVRDPEPLPEGVTDDPATWPGQIRRDHLDPKYHFNSDEEAIARRLAQSGPNDIEPIPRRDDRTADALVNGEPTEFKTVHADPPSHKTIKHQLSGSGAGMGQGGNIIIDARHTPLTKGQAIRGIAAYLNAAPENLAKVSRIRIWGADFDLDWRRDS